MTTADISVHNVKSITVSDRRQHDRNNDDMFFTRDIIITNDRGESIVICVYSCHGDDEETAIKVQS